MIPPTEIGVSKNTESKVVTVDMLGSLTVTVLVLMTVEKFGEKLDSRVCGVMFCSVDPVMTLNDVVVPTAR